MLWDYSSDKITIANRIICKLTNKQLNDANIIIPNEQRILDVAKLNDIVDYQLHYLQEYNRTNFLGVINIHYCTENNNYYLVDGQHRFRSMIILIRKHSHCIEVAVEFTKVQTYKEVISNYNLINKNTTLPEFPKTINKDIPEQAAFAIQQMFPTIWSKSHRARRPHIYFNFFQEALGVLTDKLNIDDHKKLIQIILDYNSKISKWKSFESVPKYKTISHRMLSKCSETGLYLGLFTHISNEIYGYEWVVDIIQHFTGEKIKKMRGRRKLKRKIPKKIKDDSWNIYIGKKIGETLCIVCRKTMINSKNFHAGHIISEKNGGSPTIDNILPICAACNHSMGTRNIDDFIAEHYPNNLNRFKNRDYSQSGSSFLSKLNPFS